MFQGHSDRHYFIRWFMSEGKNYTLYILVLAAGPPSNYAPYRDTDAFTNIFLFRINVTTNQIIISKIIQLPNTILALKTNHFGSKIKLIQNTLLK